MAALTVGQYVKATDGTHIATDGVKRYVALLNQASTDPPVATVLENTLGQVPTFEYADAGSYFLIVTGNAFTANKTAVFVGTVDGNTGTPSISPVTAALNGDSPLTRISIKSFNLVSDQIAPSDSQLANTSIEIRVYS